MAKAKYIVLVAIGIGMGICMTVLLQDLRKAPPSGGILTISTEKGEGKHVLTSPLLDCEVNESGALQLGLVPFGDELDSYVDTLIDRKMAKNIAVYYRDLSNGPWSGVNDSESFLPASLLKVPVMIAYLKASEDDPAVLGQKIKFETEFVAPDGGIQTIVPSKSIELGKEYTAWELVEHAIVYSDNQATQLLYEHIDGRHVFDVYRRIGVSTDAIERPGAVLAPRDYSAFFRVLHNASYLNRENSEKALELLTRAEHTRGLVAGIPEGSIVAHKFGEAGSTDELLQYHDCGIVYHPKRHYILCVMTKGSDRGHLIESIKLVSQFVWQKVDEQTRVARSFE